MEEITIVDVPATKVAGITRTGPYRTIAELMPVLYHHLIGKGIQPAGPPIFVCQSRPNSTGTMVSDEPLRRGSCRYVGQSSVAMEVECAERAAAVPKAGPRSSRCSLGDGLTASRVLRCAARAFKPFNLATG